MGTWWSDDPLPGFSGRGNFPTTTTPPICIVTPKTYERVIFLHTRLNAGYMLRPIDPEFQVWWRVVRTTLGGILPPPSASA